MKRKSYKGLTGFWTKWGGRVDSPLSNQYDTPKPWYCQSCGELYPPQFMKWRIKLKETNDYFSICSLCFLERGVKFWRKIVLD